VPFDPNVTVGWDSSPRTNYGYGFLEAIREVFGAVLSG